MSGPRMHIDHMVFNVTDLNKAVDFYTSVLGMRVTMRFEDRRMAFLSFGDRLADIRLFEIGGTDDPDRQHHGFNHVAFEPDGDLETLNLLEARLQSHGASIEGWEGHAEGRHKSLYFHDPDGNRLEFYWENPSWREESRRKVDKAFNR